MTLKDVVEYLDTLDELERNNDWLPSPHEIKPYIEYVQELLRNDNWEEDLLNLEDRLHEHYMGAYEQ